MVFKCVLEKQLWGLKAKFIAKKYSIFAVGVGDFINNIFVNFNCSRNSHPFTYHCTDMLRLTTGIRSEKCVVRRFRRCANVIEYIYANLDSIAYYTPMLYGVAYCF